MQYKNENEYENEKDYITDYAIAYEIVNRSLCSSLKYFQTLLTATLAAVLLRMVK